ncbi:MAG: DUF5683 domain-containing protein [Muribaculaceae bacterium]
MFSKQRAFLDNASHMGAKKVLWVIILLLITQFNVFSEEKIGHQNTTLNSEKETADSAIIIDEQDDFARELIVVDSIIENTDSTMYALTKAANDSVKIDDEWVEREVEFVPDPTRAVWLSAIFPGLGQIYNRRYWKLPLIVGGYLGLGYATNWNNTMLKDYTRAFADLTDNDPTTKSYMDFFPSTVKEEDLDKTWLNNILKSRKNYYRRNRDLCIISMVGVYLLAMVDAYVDASLSHFDISPDLSMDISPAVMQDTRGSRPSFGINWAINF